MPGYEGIPEYGVRGYDGVRGYAGVRGTRVCRDTRVCRGTGYERNNYSFRVYECIVI